MSSRGGVSAAERQIERFEQASFRTPMPKAKDQSSILQSEHGDCNRTIQPRLTTRSEISLIEDMKKLMKPSNVASMWFAKREPTGQVRSATLFSTTVLDRQ
jgi:hypothetical protein